MVQNGNWILPHLNGAVYAEKPPLFFWLVNLSTFFLGEDSEFANRLPSALAGLITIFLTFLFGERLFNTRVGFLSSSVLGTCFFFPQISRWMMMDSLYTLFFLLSLFYFYRGFGNDDRRRRYYLFAGLFMGLGVLTKGPTAYLPLLIFVIFAFSQKGIKKFWNRDLLFGFLLSVAVIFLWLIPACWMGGEEYTQKILFGRTILRLVGSGRYFHPQSCFFYFIRFPVEFLPWTFFIPAAFVSAMRKRKEKRKEILFLFIWFVVIFIFFTISKTKKDNYILPLYPAAAMFVGWLWDSKISSNNEKKGVALSLLLLIFLFLIGFSSVLSGLPQRFYPQIQPYASSSVFILLYLLIGSSVSILLLLKGKKFASILILVIVFIFLHLHLSYVLTKELNSNRSMRPFSEKILKRMEIGDEIKTYRFKSNGLIYYTRKPYIEEIGTKDRFMEVFRSSHRVFVVVLSEMFDKLKRDTGIEIAPIEQVKVGHWNYILISNH